MSETLARLQRSLRELTPARVSLARTGDSLATTELLGFQLAHARARDAVHAEFSAAAFAQRLTAELALLPEAVSLRTNAGDRATYLRHPELGRTLHADSRALLVPGDYDLAITIADGLSSLAVERHAIPLLRSLLPLLAERHWRVAPLTLVQQGRVAVGDPIAETLNARSSLVLIGERPGLTSADSLGAYLTWAPATGRTDADRNCVSNIRMSGLPPEAAAARLMHLLEAAHSLGATGTTLKEGTGLTLSSAKQLSSEES